MKKLLQLLGTCLFWLGWPFWFVYFKINNRRSRVLVVVDSKVLLLKTWLGTGSWGLPGGGAHRSENLLECAIRECREEIGLNIAETALRPIGERDHKHKGLSYHATFFALELTEMPEVKLQTFEIAESAWIAIPDAKNHELDDDVVFALDRYQPLDQTELL